MRVDEFDFDLPESLIAQTPLQNRTASRLLTLNRSTGEIAHRQFTDLIQYLRPGDTLVFNDTKVIPARLYGVKKDTGAKAEILLLKPAEDNRYEALVRPGKRLKTGAVILFGGQSESDAAMTAEVVEEREGGIRILHFRYDGIFHEILDRLGTMPLPPYIKTQLEDKDRYQTVYARERGSAAAPTAGLHFTEAFMMQLRQQGVDLAYVTLHVGLGTFRPVSVDTVESHQMHAEYYDISEETAAKLQQTRARGGRIIAVGTTTVRTLETAANLGHGEISACSGWSDIFIYPGYQFQAVDAIFTNFHLPKSTLIMMISAFAGKAKVMGAYQEAIAHKYRFFSFGDAMFIYN